MKIQWLKKVSAVYCALGFALLTAIPTKAAETAEKTVSEYAVSSYTGLANYGDNVWQYQINGIVQETYTGLVEYYGTWYYIENGTLNWNYTGLTKYYDTWYYVEQGRLNWGYTGLIEYYGTWYYVETGASELEI